MKRFNVVCGVGIMALGLAILFTSHSVWGLRGVLYELLGSWMVYDGLGKGNEHAN